MHSKLLFTFDLFIFFLAPSSDLDPRTAVDIFCITFVTIGGERCFGGKIQLTVKKIIFGTNTTYGKKG